MNEITNVFRRLNREGKKALIPYVTGGDPSIEKTYEFMEFLARNGADIIEVGIPFSDPMADGPVIQRASERALKAGTAVKDIFALVRRFNKAFTIPVVLMGYLNPIYAYGVERFVSEAADNGVKGLIIVDMPPEEAGEICPLLRKYGIASIFLATPVTNRDRILKIKKIARGFLYFVSVTGVTGERDEIPTDILEKIKEIKGLISLPVTLGFGISHPRIVEEFFPYLDGFVVGSALVRRWEHSFSVDDPELKNFFQEMVIACHGS
ncbi:MAG: tryptophan synthase subunit alpha [Syntrophales bacterium]|nr:tryptophan synthase subunit alpha [Syntrophales bacterium]